MDSYIGSYGEEELSGLVEDGWQESIDELSGTEDYEVEDYSEVEAVDIDGGTAYMSTISFSDGTIGGWEYGGAYVFIRLDDTEYVKIIFSGMNRGVPVDLSTYVKKFLEHTSVNAD